MKRSQVIKAQAGFTLFELVIVIVIISILASLAVPLFLNLEDRAKDAQKEATLISAQTAISTYIGQNSQRPKTDDLVGFLKTASEGQVLGPDKAGNGYIAISMEEDDTFNSGDGDFKIKTLTLDNKGDCLKLASNSDDRVCGVELKT